VIRVYRRPVEEADLGALTKGRGSFARNVLMFTAPGTVVLLAAVYLISRSWLAATAIAGLFLVGSVTSNARFFRKVRDRRASGADRTMVEVMEVEATRVIDIEPQGSHGPAYCFFAGDGQAVLLVGQWLLERRKFPTLAFRLSRWVEDGQPIRIEAIGKKVKPEPSTVSLRGGYSNRDVEVFTARPDTLQQDLDAAFGRR
jgi:hypothetical protein